MCFMRKFITLLWTDFLLFKMRTFSRLFKSEKNGAFSWKQTISCQFQGRFKESTYKEKTVNLLGPFWFNFRSKKVLRKTVNCHIYQDNWQEILFTQPQFPHHTRLSLSWFSYCGALHQRIHFLALEKLTFVKPLRLFLTNYAWFLV